MRPSHVAVGTYSLHAADFADGSRASTCEVQIFGYYVFQYCCDAKSSGLGRLVRGRLLSIRARAETCLPVGYLVSRVPHSLEEFEDREFLRWRHVLCRNAVVFGVEQICTAALEIRY
jgi:hypothetical protein